MYYTKKFTPNFFNVKENKQEVSFFFWGGECISPFFVSSVATLYFLYLIVNRLGIDHNYTIQFHSIVLNANLFMITDYFRFYQDLMHWRI